MNQIDEILKGQDYFYCQKLSCRFRVSVCLKRQAENKNVGENKIAPFRECLTCEQGPKIYKTMGGGNMIESSNAVETKKGNQSQKDGEKPVRFCECGKKTLSPNCPYCPSCMSKKSRTNKVEKENKEASPSEDLRGVKLDIKSPLIAPKTPVQIRLGNDILIDFSSHDDILRGIEKLAEEEVRPVGLQIIYILKNYLKSQQTL